MLFEDYTYNKKAKEKTRPNFVFLKRIEWANLVVQHKGHLMLQSLEKGQNYTAAIFTEK